MPDSRWERLAAASGILFVVSLIIQGVLLGTPPKVDDSTATIAAYFTDHRTKLLASWYIVGLGIVFFFWFLGSLRHTLTQAEGGTGRLSTVAFGAGVAAAALAMVTGGVQTALAFKAAGEGNPAVVRAFFDLSNMVDTMTGFPLAAFILATSVVMIRTSAVSRWLGWAGLLVGLAILISSAAIFPESGPLASKEVVGYIAFILFGVWLLATSIIMVVRKGETATPTS